MKVLIIIMVACKENNQMKYWLLKSEPNVWSINQQQKAGAKGALWDDVKIYFNESFCKIGGRFVNQGFAFSNAAEALKTIGSSRCLPIICNPTGKPFLV